MNRTLENRSDLEIIFRNFYQKAMVDIKIGYFFTKIIPIDLETHLPHILDFWEYNLWGKKNYSKNLIQIHLNIHKKSRLNYDHFDRWVQLLHECVDSDFYGTSAERLKTNALSIATVMKTKVN